MQAYNDFLATRLASAPNVGFAIKEQDLHPSLFPFQRHEKTTVYRIGMPKMLDTYGRIYVRINARAVLVTPASAANLDERLTWGFYPRNGFAANVARRSRPLSFIATAADLTGCTPTAKSVSRRTTRRMPTCYLLLRANGKRLIQNGRGLLSESTSRPIHSHTATVRRMIGVVKKAVNTRVSGQRPILRSGPKSTVAAAPSSQDSKSITQKQNGSPFVNTIKGCVCAVKNENSSHLIISFQLAGVVQIASTMFNRSAWIATDEKARKQLIIVDKGTISNIKRKVCYTDVPDELAA